MIRSGLSKRLTILKGVPIYGKSYESKYTGSMVGAGINVFAVWDYITTMARRGYIEVNPELLAFTLGGKDQDPREIQDALDFLQQPDPLSRSPLEEGRRIVKEGKYLYRLVNWDEYNRIRNELELREYNRVKQAEWRARPGTKKPKRKTKAAPLAGANGPPLAGETQAVKDYEAGQPMRDPVVERMSQNSVINNPKTTEIP